MTYVFDTEPIIAWLYDERGSERVQALLEEVAGGEREGVIADANAAEIVYLDARLLATARGDSEPTVEDVADGVYDMAMLERAGVRVEDAGWQGAGRVKAPGGLSLGDAYAVAHAVECNGTLVVGADDDFDDLPVDVDIQQFRTGPD